MKSMLFIFTISISLLSCEENSKNLSEQIVGNWVDNSGHNLSFFEDGTFVDSTFPYYVSSGSYEIIDNILKCRNVQFTIIQPSDSNMSFGGICESFDIEIRINKGLMEARSIYQLSPLGHNGSTINGKWVVENLAYDIQKINGQFVLLYTGASIKTFTFDSSASQDSCYYTRQFVGTTHYDITENIALSKNSSQIEFESGPFLRNIPLQWRLLNGKMYWYFVGFEFAPYLTKK